jgi:hypothetical protein
MTNGEKPVTSSSGPLIPDFLILGAQKCGTSSLASALRSHPDIFISALKEAQHYGFVPDEQVGGDSYREFFRDRAFLPTSTACETERSV